MTTTTWQFLFTLNLTSIQRNFFKNLPSFHNNKILLTNLTNENNYFSGTITWNSYSFTWTVIHDVIKTLRYDNEKQRIENTYTQNAKIISNTILPQILNEDYYSFIQQIVFKNYTSDLYEINKRLNPPDAQISHVSHYYFNKNKVKEYEQFISLQNKWQY